MATGYNRLIIPGKTWEISAICDAILNAGDAKLIGGSIFCSYFPELDDVKLMVATGITSVFFSGKVTDNVDAVALLNCLPDAGITLEITQFG